MGNKSAKLNVSLLSAIIQSKEEHIEGVLNVIEEESAVADSRKYNISAERLKELMEKLLFHPSDVKIVLDIYCIVDLRGLDECDIREVFITFSVLVCKSVEDCVAFALRIWDREKELSIDKIDLRRVLHLMNDTFSYFGDKSLERPQVDDLVDSIYSAESKIDGRIPYPDYYEKLKNHPVVEMLMSPQFQQFAKEKYLDEERLEVADFVVR